MIRLALIGRGGMGGALVRGLELQQSRLQVAAAVDMDAGRAQAAATHFPGAMTFTDCREALEDVDAVLIALPHHLHHPVGMDCLRAGKHVFMEKPLANSEQQLFNRGITTIRLGTFEGHSQAINFYNKNGWSVTGIQEDKDHGFNMILFEKKA